jgi:hypothetical protein
MIYIAYNLEVIFIVAYGRHIYPCLQELSEFKLKTPLPPALMCNLSSLPVFIGRVWNLRERNSMFEMWTLLNLTVTVTLNSSGNSSH